MSSVTDPTTRARSRWWRLAAAPFELGQHEYAAFANQPNVHDMLIDRLGGPLGVQIGLLVGVITLTGGNDPAEVRVGLGVGAAAVLASLVLMLWGHLLSLRAITAGPVLAAVLLVIAGTRGGALADAVPALSVVVGTAVFAQRPWRLSLAFAGLLGVSYAIVLAEADLGPAPVSRWVIVVVTVVSSGAFVHWLRSKVLMVVEADLEARQRAEGAARELTAISQARSELLARMSHHLRTPLNAIVGFTSILQSGRAGPLTERQAEYLEDVRSASLHLTDLVDELFDLARIEAGDPRLGLEPTDLRDVIGECVRLVREGATRSGVTVTATIEPGLPPVLADSRRLRQVLLNLMANAVRYTSPGGSVWVRAWSKADRVHIAVKDTGIGIPLEDQQRMFDRFEQGPESPGSAGLGLSLARRFVEQHGGEISVVSQPGEGATFAFWLPRRPTATIGSPEPPESLSPVETELFSALIEPGSGANRSLIALVGRWLCLQAAFLAVILASITPGPVSMRVGVAVFALAALAVMVVLRPFTEHAPIRSLDLIAVFGVIGISAVVLVTGSFAGLAALGYGWLLMTAFAPWARGSGRLELFSVAAAYAVVLALQAGPGSEVAAWITVVGLLGLNGLTVRSLVQKLRVMVFAEREARLKAEALEDELHRAASHKDDFVGTMSHELRTPLHAIIGFSDILVKGAGGELTPLQRQYVNEVGDAAQELLGLIDDILTLAKLESDAPRLTLAPIPVAPAVAGATSRSDLFDRVRLAPEEDGDVAVLVDRSLFERAVDKLLRNAATSSPPDQPIEVRIERDVGQAVVQVRSAGPPLPPALSERLDVPLSRVDDLKGPLLGLVFAQRVAAVHGGDLSYERIDDDNTFTLRLPEVVG